MKKSSFKLLRPDSAAYVVAHGRWQQSRGRNPSTSILKRALVPERLYGRRAFHYALSRLDEVAQHQQRVDEAILGLSSIDFTDTYSVADWLYGSGFADAISYFDVEIPWREVLHVFERNGIVPGVVDTSEGYGADPASYTKFLLQVGINLFV